MISTPEDYGYTFQQTLEHMVTGEKPEPFNAYWEAFCDEVSTLPTRFLGSIDGETNPIVIPSLRSVRVAGRVTMPTGGAVSRGVVVTTHGYTVEQSFPDGPEPWSTNGMITLRLRVRGFPPSTQDMPSLGDPWILHKLESAESWVMRGAVADLIQACRCARLHWPDLPIYLHGESFGGGLAVIAASQLAALGMAVERMTIGLPSFGDWRWRRSRYCNGAGRLINMLLDSLRQEEEKVMQNLLLFDAALHARLVDVPTLCKLALLDDCVPAPSAAAVFNALAGEKRLFLTRYGHFEGGLADLRRHVAFERMHRTFLDSTCLLEAFDLSFPEAERLGPMLQPGPDLTHKNLSVMRSDQRT